ncbi:MAG: hypothetical protein HC905_25530 [Bacteroidales bacterium]|nr:hypothetical protein [Bacteroidales bacterium]
MMSDRLCLLFFLLLVLWVSTQALPEKINLIATILIAFLHFGLFLKHHNGSLKSLNRKAVLMNNASDYIKAGSIVLPVNLSDNWVEFHFSNYLGIDKPMVILENYEASLSWFPINWNILALPRITLDKKDEIKGIRWKSNIHSQNIREIDYVLIMGNTAYLKDEKWQELKNIILSNYKKIYASSDDYIWIFELRK